jgi:hypothetical protein|tara:strand:+ start:763 stop:990 length:228 start_codon:yes stop_codon:yes gene_type:complete
MTILTPPAQEWLALAKDATDRDEGDPGLIEALVPIKTHADLLQAGYVTRYHPNRGLAQVRCIITLMGRAKLREEA